MEQKKQLGVNIEGSIYASNENESVDIDEFLDAFIEFVESKGWIFGGGTE